MNNLPHIRLLVGKIESQMLVTEVLLKELRTLLADSPDNATTTASGDQVDTHYSYPDLEIQDYKRSEQSEHDKKVTRAMATGDYSELTEVSDLQPSDGEVK